VTEGQSRRAEQSGRRPWAPAASVFPPAVAVLVLLGSLASAAPPRLPRSLEQVTKVLAQGPHAGDCESCHSQHGGGSAIPYEHALIGPDENTLCDGCHSVPWSGGSYPGTMGYNGSSHAWSPVAIWPGPDPPGRVEAGAAGKCLNCHEPHGWQDAAGLIPSLGLAREEKLCLACHDGSPATTDIRADALKPFAHPMTFYNDRHSGPTESSPSDFAISPLNRRHAECEDCHNPHTDRGDGGLRPPAPAASKVLLGASRVGVLNGAAGSAPSYTFISGSDTLTAPVTEYQLCFKCHSSWTTQPPGQTDFALVFNPANPSSHPVEDMGANRNINFAAFASGWSGTSIMRCGDCHGSELGPAGPHGSTYRFILKGPYTASPTPRATASNELCFNCHAYDVYANATSPAVVQGASRFNQPAVTMGHADHVDTQQVPCYACHTTHGSVTQPHLIATGRIPGIAAYSETAGGGTCTPNCHGPRTYTVNYAR
jgi:predicted CXXCH cytochrome family protein